MQMQLFQHHPDIGWHIQNGSIKYQCALSILFHLWYSSLIWQIATQNLRKIRFKRSLFIVIFTYLKCSAVQCICEPFSCDHFRRICFKSTAIKNNRANVCGNWVRFRFVTFAVESDWLWVRANERPFKCALAILQSRYSHNGLHTGADKFSPNQSP